MTDTGILLLPTEFLLLLPTPKSIWAVYAGLFFASFVKFALAAIAAMGNPNLNFAEILLTIGGGALLSVPFYTFFGEEIRKLVQRIFPRRKPMSFSRRRKIYKIWHRYGLAGVAFLAPLISPMLSVGIAVAFQEKPRRIVTYVGASVLGWTLVFALLRESVLELLTYFSLIS